MSLLKRYLLFEFIIKFSGILVVLVSLYIGIDVLSKFWSVSVSFPIFIKYYYFKIAVISSQMIPISTLMTTLTLFTYLAKNNELLALYTAGRSLFSIIRPLLFLVIFFCVFSFFLNESYVPRMEYKAKNYWYTKILKQNSPLDNKQEKTWFRGSNFIYSIKNFDSKTNIIYGVNIYYQDKYLNILKHIYASKIEYKNKKWFMVDYKSTKWFWNGKVNTVFGKNEHISLNSEPSSFSEIEIFTDYLSISQLIKNIKELRSIGMDPYKFEVKLNDRFSFSLISLIMFLLAIPFSVKQSRQGGTSLNIAFSFVLVLFYWISYSFFINYGTVGVLSPVFSAWSVNAFFLIVAIFSFKKIKK